MKRVLMLDDHEASLVVTRRALSSTGCWRFVRTIPEAVGCAAVFRPEVVLYEWSLRTGASFGFARTLREILAPGQLVIAAVSASNEPKDFVLREALDGYFTKPVDMRAIAAFVRGAAYGVDRIGSPE